MEIDLAFFKRRGLDRSLWGGTNIHPNSRAIFFSSLDAWAYLIQPSPNKNLVWIVSLWCFCQHIVQRSRGDEDCVKIRSTERKRRRLRCRQCDDTLHFSVGIITSNTCAEPLRAPEKALRIHSQSVRKALFTGNPNEDSPIRQVAGFTIPVVRIDTTCNGI